MATWTDLASELDVLLEDSGGASYPEALRVVAWNRACEYFATTHTAPLKRVVATPKTVEDIVGLLVSLPEDCLQIGGINNGGKWLEPNLMIPGEDEDTSGYWLANGGIYLPDTTITAVTLWYYAFYAPAVIPEPPADPQVEEPVLDLPRWAEWPVLNLAISYLLIPAAVGVSDLRRFQTKREAGVPEDNPSRAQAKYHFQHYLDAVGKVRPQDREFLYRPGR